MWKLENWKRIFWKFLLQEPIWDFEREDFPAQILKERHGLRFLNSLPFFNEDQKGVEFSCGVFGDKRNFEIIFSESYGLNHKGILPKMVFLHHQEFFNLAHFLIGSFVLSSGKGKSKK